MFARNDLRNSEGLAARFNAPRTLPCGNSFVRALLALVACTFAFGTTACSKAPLKPPEAPLKQAINDDAFEEEELFDTETHHLAPPPAYGNKVVMAQHADETSGHF